MVITYALHAEGHQFDPGTDHQIGDFMLIRPFYFIGINVLLNLSLILTTLRHKPGSLIFAHYTGGLNVANS